MRVLGIDEAGRGCVIGPLVICGYLINTENVAALKKAGARDSKLLTPRKREALAPALEKLSAGIRVNEISAAAIDQLRTLSNLNRLEIVHMQQLINHFEPDKVIIDAVEANERRFRDKVAAGLRCRTKLIAENFADKNYPVVGAASVIAKVHRDREIQNISRAFAVGSGYTSDPATIAFLKSWMKENNDYPDFVRKSWVTSQLIKEEKEQKQLTMFSK